MTGHTRSRHGMRSRSRRLIQGAAVLTLASALMFTGGGLVAAQPETDTTTTTVPTTAPKE